MTPLPIIPIVEGGSSRVEAAGMVTSVAFLVEAIRRYALLDAGELEEVTVRLQRQLYSAHALARELIRRSWLTAYQANQLLKGKGDELVLGPYVLLERLGEGGMGQVFKARHRGLGRIAAVKVIRKDQLGSSDAVRRFEREVRAAAALAHPNIVRAYDADRIGTTLLLVMEYIEGATDLGRVVERNGPLPVERSCDYIRQAALGLQHAHERGLVHRDIKPHNLLLTADQKTVKVLDMGLARLDNLAADDDAGFLMTQDGMVLGTPDYIAPEQVRASHTVDIRADLYSLGCTLYYLLTGGPPFPSGTVVQKLSQHQTDEPRAVETLRPEVPAEVAALVRKLMAKTPNDRYQTPAELATVLTDIRASFGAASDFDNLELDGPSVLAGLPENGERCLAAPRRRHRCVGRLPWLVSGMVAGLCFAIGAAALLVSHLKRPAEIDLAAEREPIAAHSPSLNVPGRIDDAWVDYVSDLPAEKQVDAVTDKLREINPGWRGKLTYACPNGFVSDLRLVTDHVTNLAPVQALRRLRTLDCSASSHCRTKLADLTCLSGLPLKALYFERADVSDLTPLRNLPLECLDCSGSRIHDLAPLRGMRLTYLRCDNTPIANLSPLRGMPLKYLGCWGTKVTDLSPLRGMALRGLTCQDTAVSDLSPLQNMPLTSLNCAATRVTDLSPLKHMPLEELWCDFRHERDRAILHAIKTLEIINGRPAQEFWVEVESKWAVRAGGDRLSR
jgi:tRNA A-37 threonylcarbamoyl transferase component Bud32